MIWVDHRAKVIKTFSCETSKKCK